MPKKKEPFRLRCEGKEYEYSKASIRGWDKNEIFLNKLTHYYLKLFFLQIFLA